MQESQDAPIVAVDGGGTRCRLALSAPFGTFEVEVGSANVSSDFDRAIEELRRGLDALSQRSGLAQAELIHCPAYVGLAGMTGPEMAARLTQSLPLTQARFEDDRPAALRGALGPKDGVLGHCGTGSFLARQIDRQARIIGGWGAVLGDEASAQWMGRRALARSLDAADGVVAPSPLTERLLRAYGGTAGIVAFAGQAAPSEFGLIAQQVTEHPQDANAQALIQEGADWIAERATRLGWHLGETLCLTGGIGPVYADHLPDTMRQSVRPPDGRPLDGAIALAREMQQARP